MLTEEIKDIARRKAVHCMVGATTDFKVEGFDLGMEGGVFHREEVGDKIVYVYWVNVPTEEQYAAGLSGFQVRVSIEYKEPRPELRNDGAEEYIINGLGLDLEFEGPL